MRRPTTLILALAATAAWADDTLVAFTTSQTTAPLPFVEYLPPGYTGGTQPEALVVFFHGLGQSGAGTDATDLLDAMTAHGPLQQIRNAGTGPHRFRSTQRAILLAPRNPSGLWNASLAGSFFTWARMRYRVDPDRIYLTGLSAGGGPTWTVPKDHPGLVAATVPICPVQQVWPVTAADAVDYRNVAVWAFHGFGDPTVPREESIRWMNAIGQAVSRDPMFASVMTGYPYSTGLQSATTDQTAAWTPAGYVWRTGIGTNVVSGWRYTLFNRNDHFVWPDVYTNDDVWNWLFAQRRSLNVDPGRDGGVLPPVDAGTPPVDAGSPRLDAGTPPVDAGTPPVDAGTPPVDAGTAPVDAGTTPVDAGTPPVDAGAAPTDAGTTSEDAGAPEPDGGLVSVVDAGASVPDAGRVPSDAGAMSDEMVIGGCGCGASPTFPLLGLLLLLGWRRSRHD
jgi:MYXO-CTERM domain-containing protein